MTYAARVSRYYYLPRARVHPPEELLRQIWPELDVWRQELSTGRYNEDLAARAFCELLQQFRITILQDSVLLRKRYPANPLWCHRVFGHPLYEAFAESVESELSREEDAPQELQLKRAYPDLVEAQRQHSSAVLSGFGHLEQAVLGKVDGLDGKVNGLDDKVNGLTSMVRDIREQSGQLRGLLNGVLVPGSFLVPAPVPTALAPVPVPAILASPAPVPTALAPAPVPAPVPMAPAPALTYTHAPIAAPSAHAQEPSMEQRLRAMLARGDPPWRYRMDRSITTVEQLMTEWNQGLNGGPPVSLLDELWGAGWRKGDSAESVWWSSRRVIVEEVRRLARENGGSLQMAVIQLDAQRRASPNPSLDKLCRILRAGRRAANCQ